ncbi:isoprenylcysteine carboxyl methyltransferase [Vallitalea longa]|uniref:Isoprenylcysteine carboxyl methyltransferase n=1 Tax=Vallitalea longa TaxID=2936439 RepID=A0A9W5YFH2_9FIRM|nr:isoprenylcysteine carboxylmethyltransferase family protein [Vallitalea longa]GKX31550.1 isoprenylcysteine carboxyl methyltransferase [Vallitalea longa]
MNEYLKYKQVFLTFSEYKYFNYALYFLFISEFIIWLFTSSFFVRKGKSHKHEPTLWIIIAGWIGSFILSYYFIGDDVSYDIRRMLLPHGFYYIGLCFLIFGTVLRDYSVWILKRAFTLNVQTTEKQKLMKIGPYRLIRNPAYTGSIISLLGISLSLRSIFSPILVLILCLVCYSIRINVEEKALAQRFGDEFTIYKKNTKRLIPYIY